MSQRALRSLRPEKIASSIAGFDPKYAVTSGEFTFDVASLLSDMEWNHMDQLHRPFIHNTYSDNLRIALGRDFALSLTRFGRWPFLITVTDTRVGEGIYFQDFVLGGVIFVHNTITMHETNEMVRLKIEWTINSHWLFKPLHGLLSRMFYNLNVRLQQEDATIRSQRYTLRKQGYNFLSDPPDYFTSNQVSSSTVYPALPDNASIGLEGVSEGAMTCISAGNIDFLVLREDKETLIWPAACPHEGGELAKGKLHADCRLECPWHGFKYSAVRLSDTHREDSAHGFGYILEGNLIHIRRVEKQSVAA